MQDVKSSAMKVDLDDGAGEVARPRHGPTRPTASSECALPEDEEVIFLSPNLMVRGASASGTTIINEKDEKENRERDETK